MKDLKAFLDGELDAAGAAAMQARLQSEDQLSAIAASFRRISASLGEMSQGPTATGRENALAAIRKPRPSAFSWRVAGAMASVLLLAVVLLQPLRQQVETAAHVGTLESPPPGLEAPLAADKELPAGNGPARKEEATGSAPGNEVNSYAGAADANLYERKVVKTASLDVRVTSIDQAEAKVTTYVESARGYIENSSSTNLDGSTPSMTLTVRVPQPKFSETLATFEKLGERTAKDVQASDVTQSIVDLDARLINLRSQEETYRAILRGARRIGEIIDVQQRISAIRGEIESMQAQRDSMAKLAAMSTITLTLSQRPPADEATGGWAQDTWADATRALSGAFRSLSMLAIWVMVYAPIWIPLAILSAWGWRRALRA